ncbi:MAG: TraB/GumN family protein [Sphingobacteriales bacterium]|nr:MAG: TraB/GumN family protein [Sphingobacteriales bacterium]
MKKIIIGTIAAFLALMPISSVIAQGKAKTAQQKTVDQNSLLWKISGNGLTKPSYVFGTIHLICQEDFFWNPAMEAAFKAAEKICMEMDMDDPQLQMTLAMGMMDKDGKKLSSYFEPEDYEKLKAYAAARVKEVPVSILDMMKPAAVWTTMILLQYNCNEVKSYEVELVAKAKEGNKEILGLETAHEQLDFLLGMPDTEVVENINDIVQGKSKAEMDAQFAAMINAYKKQELNKLYELSDQETAMKMDKVKFLDNRNKNWIPKMKDMMAQQPTFFAVGAAHLPGKAGVLQLLKTAGYTVEPVK